MQAAGSCSTTRSPFFGFRKKDTALETAHVMASARVMLRGLPTCVQILGNNGAMELAADYE